MNFQSLLNGFVFGVTLTFFLEEDLFNHFQSILIKTLLDKHLSPPSPNGETIFSQSECNLGSLMQNLVASSQLLLTLQ